jgi:methionyl-tRNA synthetase
MADWTFITATPPTPNGDLHVGHVAGPYVAADVLRRYLCGQGLPTLLATGQDDHQSYVQLRGRRDGRPAESVADHYAAAIEGSWRAAHVEFDVIVRPRRDDGYAAFVQQFFRTLYEKGDLVPKRVPLPYCASCDRWLYEAYVAGRCPHCGEQSGGNACEACGRPNTCGDLLDPRCVMCQTPAENRDCVRLFFPLARYADQLAAFWGRASMPPHLHALCAEMHAAGLPDIAVTHPADWGVQVPVDGFRDQRIYVWFEMAPGYLLQRRRAVQRMGRNGDWSPSDDGGRWIQFFGFDNGYFHAVLFPALFLAYDPLTRLPNCFVVNEFYQLEGKKFSTSRRHAVWAGELLATTSPDPLRHHVLADRPAVAQRSFALPALEATRQHLSSQWDGWIGRFTAELAAASGGRVPQERPAGDAWSILSDRLRATLDELRVAYAPEAFDLRRVTVLLDELVRLGADYGLAHAHYAAVPSLEARHRAGLAAQVVVAQALACWAAPVMPQASGCLAELLGYRGPLAVTDRALRLPEAGRPIRTPPGPIFGA